MAVVFEPADDLYFDWDKIDERLGLLSGIQASLDAQAAEAEKIVFAADSNESSGPAAGKMQEYNRMLAEVVREISVLVANTGSYLTQQRDYMLKADGG